jgi:hypothetical protein
MRKYESNETGKISRKSNPIIRKIPRKNPDLAVPISLSNFKVSF